MKKIMLVIALLTLNFTVNAAITPQPNGGDARMRVAYYEEDQLYTIYIKEGVFTNIVFGDDEVVESDNWGFKAIYENAKNGNSIGFKPKAIVKNESNLVVRTDKHTYNFVLKRSNTPFVQVRFRYGKQLTPSNNAKPITLTAGQKIKRKNNTIRNQNYTMHVGEKSRDLAPLSTYDDGIFTYIILSNTVDMPTVYEVVNDKETLVDSSIKDRNTIVVKKIIKEAVLRSGESVVSIYNENNGALYWERLNDGTTVNGLVREVKGGK